MASYINSELPSKLQERDISFITNGPFVAHTNRCFNDFTRIPGETQKSKNNNISGLAAQAIWLSEDLGLAPDSGSHTVKEFYETLDTISKQRNFIDDRSKEIIKFERGILEDANYKKLVNEQADIQTSLNEFEEGGKDTIKGLQKKLSDKNKEIQKLKNRLLNRMGDEDKIHYKNLKRALSGQEKLLKKNMRLFARQAHENRGLIRESNLSENQKASFNLFIQILAEQTGLRKELGYPKLSTAQKLGLELLFDLSLGCITEINCNNGLDRTGFARAMQNSLQQELKEGKHIAALSDFINNFESNVNKMDRDEPLDPDVSNEVSQFQKRIFEELVHVGLPITARSTGMLGLKWHLDKKSLNPLKKKYAPIAIHSSHDKVKRSRGN